MIAKILKRDSINLENDNCLVIAFIGAGHHTAWSVPMNSEGEPLPRAMDELHKHYYKQEYTLQVFRRVDYKVVGIENTQYMKLRSI